MDSSFGNILKAYREERDLSIKQVSIAIKLSSSIIKNIEAENFDKLPKIVFTRGLIKAYCKYLDVDDEKILTLFDKKTNFTASKAKRISLPEEETPKAPLFITFSRTFMPLIIILVLAASGYGIFYITQKYRKEISTVVTKNIQAIHTAKDKGSEALKTLKENSINSLKANKESEAEKKVSAASQKENTPTQKSENSKVSKKTNTVTSETKIDPKDITQKITLEPLAKTLVQIQLDDEDVQKIILRPDVNRTFQAKKKIKLKISDAGAVNIIHNRKDLGVPGIFGQSIELEFPNKE